MTKGGIIVGPSESCNIFPKSGFGDNSKTWYAIPYRVIPFVGIDKRKAQIIGLYLNPIKNGGQFKFTSHLTLTGCHFGQTWHSHLNHLFSFTLPFKRSTPQKGVKIKKFKLLPKMGSSDFFNCNPFLRYNFFQIAWKMKNNGAVYRWKHQPCLQLQSVKVRQLVNFN